jgi:NitT/TauT family transport system permease protein
MKKKNILEKNAALVLFIGLLVFWQGICSVFHVSEFIFPSPIQISQNLI